MCPDGRRRHGDGDGDRQMRRWCWPARARRAKCSDEEAVRTLPITSRNVYNFHLIGPGVKGLPSTGFGTTQFLVGGHNRMTWSMDGLDNSQRRTNRQIRLVISTPENVEEMQVLTGAYSAEFGRAAGGVINVISRSGTNAIRGGAMALLRPNQLVGAAAARHRQAGAGMVDGAGQRRRAARARPRVLLRELRVQPAEGAAAGDDQSRRGRGHRHSGLGPRQLAVRRDVPHAEREGELPGQRSQQRLRPLQPLHQRSARRRRRPDDAEPQRVVQGPDARHRRAAGDDVRQRSAERAALRLQPPR